MAMLTRTHLWQPRDRAWRSRPTGKAFLALLVMVTFGLFPFHQILHLVFADHSHRYCRVHYQIEDVYPADDLNSIVIGTEDPANETVQPPGAASRDRNQSHHGCDILNLCFESKSVSALRANGVRQPDATRVASSDLAADFVGSCPLVLLSPKHSPPQAFCR